MRIDVGAVIRKDTVFQNQTDGEIMEEIKTPTETETNLKANNE